MSAADTPMGEAPSQPKLSEVERITNVFTAPSKTFADLKRNASWFAPFLLLAVMSLIYVAVVDKKIGWDQVVENQFSAMSEKQKAQIDQMPAEAQQRQKTGMIAGFKYGSYAAPIFFGLFFAVLAAVYMAIYNFGLGAEATFKQSYAILMYASLPTLIRSALAIGTVFMVSDTAAFNFENPVVTNPGFLSSQAENPALYSFLSKLDIFTLWCTYLTGLGFSSISKIKAGTAIGVAFGVYFAWVLLAVGFNLAFR